MAAKYFLFSKEQLDHRTKVEAQMGNKYLPGEVIVNGIPKRFTELSDSPNSRFSDAIVVTKGDTDVIKYTEPYAE